MVAAGGSAASASGISISSDDVVICTVILADLCFCGVLLLFLGLLWIGLSLILWLSSSPVLLDLDPRPDLALIFLILVWHIRVITQLIAIPQIADNLAANFANCP